MSIDVGNGRVGAAMSESEHDATIAKYRRYVTTSFVAAIEPVVVARAAPE